MRTSYDSPSRDRGPRTPKASHSWHGYTIRPYAAYPRYWALYDPAGELVCLTVYKRGAEEVVRRLVTLPVVVDGSSAGDE
jgi:hypothetical protein